MDWHEARKFLLKVYKECFSECLELSSYEKYIFQLCLPYPGIYEVSDNGKLVCPTPYYRVTVLNFHILTITDTIMSSEDFKYRTEKAIIVDGFVNFTSQDSAKKFLDMFEDEIRMGKYGI